MNTKNHFFRIVLCIIFMSIPAQAAMQQLKAQLPDLENVKSIITGNPYQSAAVATSIVTLGTAYKLRKKVSSSYLFGGAALQMAGAAAGLYALKEGKLKEAYACLATGGASSIALWMYGYRQGKHKTYDVQVVPGKDVATNNNTIDDFELVLNRNYMHEALVLAHGDNNTRFENRKKAIILELSRDSQWEDAVNTFEKMKQSVDWNMLLDNPDNNLQSQIDGYTSSSLELKDLLTVYAQKKKDQRAKNIQEFETWISSSNIQEFLKIASGDNEVRRQWAFNYLVLGRLNHDVFDFTRDFIESNKKKVDDNCLSWLQDRESNMEASLEKARGGRLNTLVEAYANNKKDMQEKVEVAKRQEDEKRKAEVNAQDARLADMIREATKRREEEERKKQIAEKEKQEKELKNTDETAQAMQVESQTALVPPAANGQNGNQQPVVVATQPNQASSAVSGGQAVVAAPARRKGRAADQMKKKLQAAQRKGQNTPAAQDAQVALAESQVVLASPNGQPEVATQQNQQETNEQRMQQAREKRQAEKDQATENGRAAQLRKAVLNEQEYELQKEREEKRKEEEGERLERTVTYLHGRHKRKLTLRKGTLEWDTMTVPHTWDDEASDDSQKKQQEANENQPTNALQSYQWITHVFSIFDRNAGSAQDFLIQELVPYADEIEKELQALSKENRVPIKKAIGKIRKQMQYDRSLETLKFLSENTVQRQLKVIANDENNLPRLNWMMKSIVDIIQKNEENEFIEKQDGIATLPSYFTQVELREVSNILERLNGESERLVGHLKLLNEYVCKPNSYNEEQRKVLRSQAMECFQQLEDGNVFVRVLDRILNAPNQPII